MKNLSPSTTLSGSQNSARATVASHATAADIWSAKGDQINFTGTVSVTAFPTAPQAGAERVLICAAECAFIAGSNLLITGVESGSQYRAQANDVVIVRALSTTQFLLTPTRYLAGGMADAYVYVVNTSGLESDPGAGVATFDATPASAQWLYLDPIDLSGRDNSLALAALNDAAAGYIHLFDTVDKTVQIFRVTGAFAAATGYSKIPVVRLTAGGTFTANHTQLLTIIPTGPSASATATLTNKRITPRVGSTTSSATPTINTDNVDIYRLTAQAANITSMTSNLSGTPSHGDTLVIEITGTAARTITWGASFEASTVALPTTTVGTNMLQVSFMWNSATSKWRCVGSC